MPTPTDQLIAEAVRHLTACGHCPIKADSEQALNLSGQQTAIRILKELIAVLFPGCHGSDPARGEELVRHVKSRLHHIAYELGGIVRHAIEYQCTVTPCADCDKCGEKADAVVAHVLQSLPRVQETLQADIVAAFEGDPAAQSTMEVVMCYPGLLAISVHRIAHLLYEKGTPLVPRVMSEYAHSQTGIDIHPGAQIGPGFFIDHGTGVVIGETCEIGRNVKLYQGVTLGALSFEKDAQGRLIKGTKRHPNVGDNVVIYAGATILGGQTSIGAGSVIGGNVWLTHSVPAGSKVLNQQPDPLIREQAGAGHKADGLENKPSAGI
jgi:serine O-acetyltransferase